ncbi:caspase-6-like [Silurus meridionalis]|uniref:caspase-6-like n=1 Tax=Silurus meridionalis TaxID=175797 RepID=UPI001EECB0E3|nr:caspase-6-like [Silurus meridionalis]
MSGTSVQSESKLDEYKMNQKRRGLALIFNQKTFEKSERLSERRGTDIDRDNLTQRFPELGFEVQSYNDKKVAVVQEKLREAAAANHKNADCFVCIFLSHGKEGKIEAFDNQIEIKEITDLFRGDECKSLVGTSKIFIFQNVAENMKDVTAVQGNALDELDAADPREESEKVIYKNHILINYSQNVAGTWHCFSKFLSEGIVSLVTGRDSLQG